MGKRLPLQEWASLFAWRKMIAKSDLTSTQKHVARALSEHMDARGGSCFPSVKTVCEETSLSNRAVINAIRSLRDAGFIEVEQQTSPDGRALGGHGNVNHYFATVPPTMNDVHSSLMQEAQGKHKNGERPPPRTVNFAPGNGERGSQEEVSLEEVQRGSKSLVSFSTQKTGPTPKTNFEKLPEEERPSAIRRHLDHGNAPDPTCVMCIDNAIRTQNVQELHSFEQEHTFTEHRQNLSEGRRCPRYCVHCAVLQAGTA